MGQKKYRVFMINQGDDSQRYGVGKYIFEIVQQAKFRKDDLQMNMINIGVSGLHHVQKRQQGNIIYLDIPKPFLNGQELLFGVTQALSTSVFSIINDYFTIKPDDIFHFNSNMQHFLIRKIKDFANVKIIYTVHVSMWNVLYHNDEGKFLEEWNDPDCFSIKKKNILAEIENCRLADRVIGLSNNTVNDLRTYYKVPEYKLKRIFNGIGTEIPKTKANKLHCIRKNLGILKTDFVFLFTGRVNEQKGISDLVEAFEALLSSGKEQIKLIVVGDGPLKEKLETKSQKNSNSIRFVGYVPQDEVHYYFKLSNAIVIPSLYDQNPYTILEAMAYRTPMLLTNIDAFENLADGIVCLKVALKDETKVDVGALRKCMLHLVENDELRFSLVERAYNMLLEKFSSRIMFNDTYAI